MAGKLWFAADRDTLGLVTGLTRLNGVNAAYGYDSIGQLTSAQGFEPDTTPRLNENFGYGYDAAHNLAQRTNNTLVQTFTSDGLNQLASVVRSGTLTAAGSLTGPVVAAAVNGTNAAVYSDGTFATTSGLTLHDGNNMFLTVGTNTSGVMTVSTVTATRLPETANLSYDLNGNLVSDGWKTYDYDDANELVRVTVARGWKSEFAYDGLGRRRITREYAWDNGWTQTNETHYVYDGMAVLQERDGNNAVLATYTRGLDLSGTRQGAGSIGGLLARTDAGGSAYYHADAGGNITSMTDSDGNVVARYLYDPYGNLLGKWGALADVNRYRFSSKEIHPNSGMYYYGFRFYEPNLQRWVNQDPLGEYGGINLYGFVFNDPVD
jgi:RHS repeat-associated protein